ncbi:L,D-transpeptidase [Nocardioides sp. zg-DK7169]|uniref:L,D-transpeptidase n=1 Tax=Nocardioides sp. zg-DK7169 TaxID=2736600 RepID=UPI0015529BBA|nr:L,D-transpeptidase [Nocardioides sp. zg-DK7169]
MGSHRAPVRPRYGRISALGAALVVTLVAVLGGTGVLPGGDGSVPVARDAAAVTAQQLSADPAEPDAATDPEEGAAGDADDDTADTDTADTGAAAQRGRSGRGAQQLVPVDAAAYAAGLSFDTSLPPGSGQGRRVVYSESRQRVWLVDGRRVEHTYLVSGTVHDNLEPGTYEVYSRSEDAVGIEDSGTMKWFVRFTRGPSGAAIGFHDIPVKDGVPLQGVDELGTPTSHGCIRQRRSDARRLWDFAPLGTTVVVTR